MDRGTRLRRSLITCPSRRTDADAFPQRHSSSAGRSRLPPAHGCSRGRRGRCSSGEEQRQSRARHRPLIPQCPHAAQSPPQLVIVEAAATALRSALSSLLLADLAVPYRCVFLFAGSLNRTYNLTTALPTATSTPSASATGTASPTSGTGTATSTQRARRRLRRQARHRRL